MIGKIKKHQRSFLVVLIVICMGVILVGGVYYVKALRRNLENNAVENVMAVTMQQEQAFGEFISADRERLHSYADYFSETEKNTPEDIRQTLKLFDQVDAIYLVMCLDEGWICGTSFDDIRQLDQENLDIYRSLNGSGVRDSYTGLYSGTQRFGYYETFTFSNGHKGLIQKSYNRSKVSEAFSLSFYNNQGLAYVVNQQGDILLRSIGRIDNQIHENIFDIVNDIYGQQEQEDMDHFMDALHARKTGSTVFTGDEGAYLYTYVPVESEEEWFLVSIVPVGAIATEADRILLNSQMALGLLVLILVICAVFILLIWRTHKDIEAKDQAVEYQTQLFHTFTNYLSQNTDDIYIILDQKTEKVEYISPNVERVLGVKEEDLMEYIRDSDMAADPEATDVYYTELNALSPGEAVKPRNTERINPVTHEHRYFLENAYCVDVQGWIKRVCYISDRTKERKTQNDLADALQMAQAANDAKSTFLSSISHDIRTPMNAIIGFLALMQDEADDPGTVREYIQRINAASQHLLGLINDVLDMNKIESGGASLSISELNLAEVIDEINTIIRPQAVAKNQTFDIVVSHMKYECLLGDKLRINQILINLLSNAVKYTPEAGNIEMRIEELPQVVDDYSRIRFTVSDNGLGMSRDYLEVIFDPFTREETKVTHEIQGTGLGMAITKSLVDLMGGTICVESEPGKGSIFTVELELCIQEPEDDPGFWDACKVFRMIVVDDDEETCCSIVEIMSGEGVVTDYAVDGGTAIHMICDARAAERSYDLVLLDWKMPGLNGLETARLIRKNYSDKVPILLLTAYDWSEIEQEAREIGVNHFMPKPFFMSTFKNAIRRVMDSLKKTDTEQSDVVQGMHILVVDDIEVNRIILIKILGSLGAVCDTAGNGQEAVERFAASDPGEYDLILMDVQMPLMDGYTATRTIRGSAHPSARTVPIIAMTANAFVDDVREAIASGMDAHIAKPVQIANLKTTIREVLKSRSERTDNSK